MGGEGGGFVQDVELSSYRISLKWACSNNLLGSLNLQEFASYTEFRYK